MCKSFVIVFVNALFTMADNNIKVHNIQTQCVTINNCHSNAKHDTIFIDQRLAKCNHMLNDIWTYKILCNNMNI